MASPDDILVLELEQARAQGDDARVLAIAGAMLAQGGRDPRRAMAWLEAAAERLIDANRGVDLDAAVAWAQTWVQYARSPRSRGRLAELLQLLAAVQTAERAMQDALAAGDLGVLQAAPATLPADGRRRDTGALVERCAALRADRQAEAEAIRRDLAQLIPTQLERALGLAARLAAIDLAAIPERDALARRLAGVDHLHRRAESAFETGPLPPLAAAIAALRASLDRRGDSEALVTLAEAELERRQEHLRTLRAAFAGQVDGDIQAAATTLKELATLDPGAPEAARLTEITTARMRLSALHATIESGLADPDAPEVRLALRELERSPLQRADSAQLIATLRVTTERRRIQQRANTRAVIGVAAVIGVVLLVGFALWLRDHSARSEISRAVDPERQLTLVRAYNGGLHLFARDTMRALEARLAEECDLYAFTAARRQSTVLRRIGDLEAYLVRPDARRLAQAKRELTALRLEMEDGAFASANHVADPVARLAALADYATRARDPSRAARAHEMVVTLRHELDAAAWAAVLDGDPATRSERAATYLRDPGNVLHRDQAERLLAQAQKDVERQTAQTADEQAWAAALGTRAGAQAYLERADGRHRAEAEAAVAAFLRAEQDADDNTAWAMASADGTPAQRLARLRSYLATGGQRHHAEAALTAIAAIERELDDAAWAVAASPGAPDEAEARIEAYLAGPTTRAHRAEVEELRQSRTRTSDSDAWKSAMALAQPAERILALEAYLAGSTARGYRSATKEEIARCFAHLAAADAFTLVALPREILIRVAPQSLTRLPADTLASLPVVVQARVPVAPIWAGESGVDETGRWATLALDTGVVRLRWIFPGTIATADGTTACAQGFWLADRECSQAQWVTMMGGAFSDGNPSQRQDPQLPVENVTWREVRDFVTACNAQLKRRKLASRVRLLNATEWAWLVATAADGPAGIDRGRATPWDEVRLTALAWSSEQAGNQTRACADGGADAWGIVNLFGNVREWVGAPDDRSGRAAGGSYALPRATALRAPLALGRDARFPDLGLRLIVSP